MTVSLMRFVDRFVGVPLCWVAGVVVQFRRRLPNDRRSSAVSEILVIKFFGLGSIVLATPSLALLRQIYPNARITFLSFVANRELLERMDGIDAIRTIDTTSIGRFLRSSLETIVHVRTHPYQVVLDLEFFSKFSTLLSALSKAEARGAFSLPTRWRSRILTHSVPLDRQKNVAYSFANLVSSVSGVPFDGPPELHPPAIFEDDRRRLLEKLPDSGSPIVCVNVNAG
ncbi:MAG TPA: hypothetical protein VMM37_01425, partial [Bacteroidota bacterium]|nr:hypothetical protein [Bacteroidota bacterium]